MRYLLRIILALIAVGLAAVLVLAWLSARPGFLQERVRDVLAQQLATQSQRQIQIGAVSGNLLTGLRVENLAVADERGFSHGAVVAVQTVVLKYDLLAVLHGRLTALASIRQIDLYHAYVLVDRSATGQLNLSKIFKPKIPKHVPPEQKFQPLITIHDSVVDLIAAGVAGHTVRTRLTAVNGSVKIEPVGPVRVALTMGSADAAFGSLTIRALSDDSENYFLMQGRLEDLPLRRWGYLLPASAKFAVTDGSASADFQVWVVPSSGSTVGPVGLVGPVLATLGPDQTPLPFRREVGYYAQVALEGVGVRLPASAGSLHIANARAELTPEGVEIDELAGSWQNLPLRADGWLYDLAHPRADLHLQASGVDLAALRRRLPAALASLVPGDLSGTGDLTADAVGPLQNLNATLSLSLPQGGALSTPQTGEITLGSATVRATLWDSARPAVLVDIAGTGGSLGAGFALPHGVGPGGGVPSEPPLPQTHAPWAGEGAGGAPFRVRQVGSLRAQVLQVGGAPLVAATVRDGEVSYEGTTFTHLSADVTVTGGLLRLPRVEADALGGQVQGEALVSLPGARGGSARVIANGTAAHLDLTRLPPSLRGKSAPVSGVLGGQFGVTWAGGRGQAVASLSLRDAVWGGSSPAPTRFQVQALARADLGPRGDWRVDLPLAQVQAPGARASVHGTLASSGAVDLRAELGDVDLATLPALGPGERPSGRAFGEVRVAGAWQQPWLSGQLVVFHPRYSTYQGGGVLVDFREQLPGVGAPDLLRPLQGSVEAYASYDTAIAHLKLTLAPAGSPDAAPGLSGEVSLSGVRLKNLPAQFGPAWPAQLASLTGWGQFHATLSGTTAAPAAAGALDLFGVDYHDYYVSALHAPFTFSFPTEGDQYIVVQGGTLATQGALLSFTGTVSDLFLPEWSFQADASAPDLHLERLAPMLPITLPLGGEASLPQLTVRGSAAGVTAEGHLLAPQVTLGDSQISGLDTRFSLDKGTLRVQRTTLEAAGGHLQAELAYSFADATLRGDAEIGDVDVSRALALIAPVAAGLEKTPEARAATERRWQQESLRSHGRAGASLHFHGPASALAGTGSVVLTDAGYLDRPLPDVKGSLSFDLGQRALRDMDFELQSGQALMTVTGQAQLGGRLALVAEATNVDLAAWQAWLPSGLGLGGVADVTIKAQGTTAAPDLTASVDVVSASLHGVSFDLLSIPVVKIGPGAIDVDRIIIKRGARQVVGSGHLPFSWTPLPITPGHEDETSSWITRYLPGDQPLAVTAALDNTDLSFLLPLANEFTCYTPAGQAQPPPSFCVGMTAGGAVNAQVKISGTRWHPLLEGYLRLDQGTLNRPGWRAPLSNLNANLTVRNTGNGNLVEVQTLSGRWDHTAFAGSGSAIMNQLDRRKLAQNTYNLALQVTADRQPLWPGQTLDGLNGAVTLTTEPGGAPLLRFSHMQGKIGAGAVSLGGTVNLANFRRATYAPLPAGAPPRRVPGTGADFSLDLHADQVPVAFPNVRGGVTGEVRLANPTAGAPAVLSGGLTLERATVSIPPLPLTTGPVVLPWLSPPVPDFGLNLTLAVGAGVSHKTSALVATIAPTPTALVATGSLLAPVIHGSLQIQPQSGSLPGTSFALRDLQLTYQIMPPGPGEPGLPPDSLVLTGHYAGDAEETLTYVEVGGRNIGPVHLDMTITGDLPHPPVITVKADPPLSQNQINSLIALAGVVPTGTTNTEELLSQRFADVLANGFRTAIFAPIESSLATILGLQEFSVSFSWDQPLEVRMGKYLAKNFTVNYRYLLIGPRNEQWNLALGYELPDHLRLSYGTNESGENSLRVSRSFTF
jgi:uncharacterized protein involved in outer membrane biogenesis